MSSATAAVLFDIDGTLADCNYLRIHPWCRTFAGVGVGVESWRIHRSIGMDGAELVKSPIAAAGETSKSVHRN
jgi:beta-phosphoglucomutase-like phosphatase (HAD superfamily)